MTSSVQCALPWLGASQAKDSETQAGRDEQRWAEQQQVNADIVRRLDLLATSMEGLKHSIPPPNPLHSDHLFKNEIGVSRVMEAI